MILTAMNQSAILETIDYCFRTKRNTAQIILIDGKTVSMRIPSQGYIYNPATGQERELTSIEECFSGNDLIISHSEAGCEYIIHIPLPMIAGINTIDFKETTIKFDLEPTYSPATNNSTRDYMFGDLLFYALKKDLKIEGTPYLSCLLSSKPLIWGDLSYNADVSLYADWNYLEKVSGGIRSVGAGIGIFSLSSGWEKSLWSQFRNKIKQNSIKLHDIVNESEVVVRGYLTFIKYYPDFPTLIEAVDTIEMEGGQWLPAMISTKRVNKISDINNCEWALVYLREDGLMFPRDAWERISNPINIFCEVVHTSVISEFGIAPFYLKARCAAYIKDN